MLCHSFAVTNKEQNSPVYFIFCNLKTELQFVKLRKNTFDLIYCLGIRLGDAGLHHLH